MNVVGVVNCICKLKSILLLFHLSLFLYKRSDSVQKCGDREVKFNFLASNTKISIRFCILILGILCTKIAQKQKSISTK